MKKICIVHHSVSGSTAEIAEIIEKELLKNRYSVKSFPVSENFELSDFDLVIIGSPLRFGSFTSKIRKFIKKNAEQLKNKQVFAFLSLLYIVRINNKPDFDIPCYIDPSLGIRSIDSRVATPIDLNHSLDFYQKKLNRDLHGIHLKSIAFFNGRLIIKELPLPSRIFMKLIIKLTIKEREGDFLNQDAVREWAENIRI